MTTTPDIEVEPSALDTAVKTAHDDLTALLDGTKDVTGHQARADHWAKIENAERECAAAHAARSDVGDADQVERFARLADHSHEAAESYREMAATA